jgi:tRNA (guanine26-N2/guanine27-N2)-dimethyltransferase
MTKLHKITEGKVELIVGSAEVLTKKMGVFFNPVKEFDRTLSVIFLKAVEKKKVLDLMAASGARGIRLAKEAGAKVLYNDVSVEALKTLKKNLALNKLTKRSKIMNMDANDCLAALKREKFDFIDIDPFGSPINYVFNSVKRIDKEGYLAVTATDTGPLYGVWKWKCMKKYGSMPYHCNMGHELGLRILAKAVIELGAMWNISLEPVFAHATQHYYRIYFKHRRSHADELMKKIGFIHFCEKCKERFTSGFNFMQKCSCGGRLQSAGPLYLGNFWDGELIKKMIDLSNEIKITEFLQLLLDESTIDVPYHYSDEIFKKQVKMDSLVEKLRKEGFLASRSHFNGKAIRTNAKLKDIDKAVQELL